MKKAIQLTCVSALAVSALALLVTASPAAAQPVSYSRVIDGVQVDWGVFPDYGVVRSHVPAEERMHGGPALAGC